MLHVLAQAAPGSGSPIDNLVSYGVLGIIGVVALRFFFIVLKGLRTDRDDLRDERDDCTKAYHELEVEARSEIMKALFQATAAVEKSAQANEAALRLLAEFRGWFDAKERQ